MTTILMTKEGEKSHAEQEYITEPSQNILALFEFAHQLQSRLGGKDPEVVLDSLNQSDVDSLPVGFQDRSSESEDLVEVERNRIRAVKAESTALGAQQYRELRPDQTRAGRFDADATASKPSSTQYRSYVLFGFNRALSTDAPFHNPEEFLAAVRQVRADLVRQSVDQPSMSLDVYRTLPDVSRLESEELIRATYNADQYTSGFAYQDGGQWRTANKEYYLKQEELVRDMLLGFADAALTFRDVSTAAQGYADLGLFFTDKVIANIREKLIQLTESDHETDKSALRDALTTLIRLESQRKA